MSKPVIFLLFLALSGCSATSHVLVGDTRAATNPAAVAIYTQAPEEYQTIALLELSSEYSHTVPEQHKVDVMLDELRVESAKLGANGILLTSVDNEFVLLADHNIDGSISHRPGNHKIIKGSAIFVANE